MAERGRKALTVCASIAFIIFSTARAMAVVPYNVTDLGTLGGTASAASALNDRDQVVGWSSDGSGAMKPFLWESGVMKELATVPDVDTIWVSRINESGYMCGKTMLTSGRHRALVWSPDNVVTDIGTLGGLDAYTGDINDAGKVVGPARRHDGVWQAFVWDNGVMTGLTIFGYLAGSHGINNNGQIVGDAAISSGGPKHAFLWDNGSVTDVGGFGGSECWALSVNNALQVVGWGFNPSEQYRAFFWESGTMSDLGTFGGSEASANRINEAGQVVGWADIDNGDMHAFLYEYAEDTMYDLNDLIPADSDWTLEDARGINDYGHIVGRGIKNGQTRGYLLTPAIPGDFNADGIVDRDDLAIFLGAFNTPEPGAPDMDGDGDCDRDDLAIWLGTFGDVGPTGFVGSGELFANQTLLRTETVPEPATVGLVGLGVGMLLAWCRRRR